MPLPRPPVAAVAGALLARSLAATAAPTATNVDSLFTRAQNFDIYEPTTTPHATVNGTIANGTVDW